LLVVSDRFGGLIDAVEQTQPLNVGPAERDRLTFEEPGSAGNSSQRRTSDNNTTRQTCSSARRRRR
jgi:hypothetical protein